MSILMGPNVWRLAHPHNGTSVCPSQPQFHPHQIIYSFLFHVKNIDGVAAMAFNYKQTNKHIAFTLIKVHYFLQSNSSHIFI